VPFRADVAAAIDDDMPLRAFFAMMLFHALARSAASASHIPLFRYSSCDADASAALCAAQHERVCKREAQHAHTIT